MKQWLRYGTEQAIFIERKRSEKEWLTMWNIHI